MAVKSKLFSIIIEILFLLRYDKVLLPTPAETRDGSRGLNLATTGVIAQVRRKYFRLNLDPDLYLVLSLLRLQVDPNPSTSVVVSLHYNFAITSISNYRMF
jgi:hypothetical protein